MKRQENQQPRPTAGGISVPLFNQKKRNRVPLTSAPSVNEFFSHSEYVTNTSSATFHSSTLGTHGCHQQSGVSPGASQTQRWNRQGVLQSPQPQLFDSSRPAPGPAPTKKAYTPMSHPYKTGSTGSMMGQPSYPVRQLDSTVPSRQNNYQAASSSDNAQTKPTTYTGLSHVGQQLSSTLPSPTQQHPQQSRALPPGAPLSKPIAPVMQPQSNTWKFTNSFQSQTSTCDTKKNLNQPKTAKKTQTQEVITLKPPIENSLRILTAFIDGMRHWSQFKDKVPYLFEIFATLDSAVTLGRHGAKTFLMRDGKESVQCVFYENEHELPRLIRGQVHRCVGNYDRNRDVLVCVSIRPGLPSELRNAHEAVKACDAEMRALVKSFREV